MDSPEPHWRRALRAQLNGQLNGQHRDPDGREEPESREEPEPWTLIACRNLCALMSDERDPVDHELHEPIRAVTVRRGETSFILTATEDGWRSHPIHPDLEVPLDMTVRLARRLRALLPNEEDRGEDSDT